MYLWDEVWMDVIVGDWIELMMVLSVEKCKRNKLVLKD